MISVIVPCYNPNEKYLIECIESVLQQSYADFELIIINDGSLEKYDKIFHRISCMDDRVSIIKQKNYGVSAARNYGVSIARGDYVTFVDSDDILVPCFLQDAVSIAKKTGADIIQGSRFIIQENKFHLTKASHKNDDDRVKYEILNYNNKNKLMVHMLDLSVKEYNNIGANGGKIGHGPWGKLIKREIATQIKFNENIYLGEDRIWNIKVLKQCKTISVVFKNWYIYRIHNESVAHRYDNNRVSEYTKYLCEIKNLLENDNLLVKHYRVLVFEVFCELLDGHFFNKKYQNKHMRADEIDNLVSHFPWNEMNVLGGNDTSFKRKIMYMLVRYRLYKLYHFLRKVYLLTVSL